MAYLTALLILLQRTEVQPSYGVRFERFNTNFRGIPKLLACLMIAVRARHVIDKYMSNVKPDGELLIKIIVDNLAEKSKVLDIGCGIAGYHTGWMQLRSNYFDQLYLLDASHFSMRALTYGYANGDRYYTSLSAAKRLLINSGINGDRVTIWNVLREESPFPQNEYDLIVSLMSLGFHYDVQTYWSEIDKFLKPNGRVLLDVRKNSDSERFLLGLEHYECEIISNDKKSQKFLLSRIGRS